MSAEERSLVFESLWELAMARFRVLFYPSGFKYWSRRFLGRPSAVPEGGSPTVLVDPVIEARASRIGRVVRKVARNAPFVANCVPQACAAQIMLRRRHIDDGRVFIGACKSSKPDKSLDLHAWLFVGQVCVTGDDGPGSLDVFKPLICYTFKDDRTDKT